MKHRDIFCECCNGYKQRMAVVRPDGTIEIKAEHRGKVHVARIPLGDLIAQLTSKPKRANTIVVGE